MAENQTHSNFYGSLCYLQMRNQFLRCSRGANSKIGDGILQKFKLIQALIVALIVCKNKEDPFKIESTRVVTTFLPL